MTKLLNSSKLSAKGGPASGGKIFIVLLVISYLLIAVFIPLFSFAYTLEVGIPGQSGASAGSNVTFPQYLQYLYTFAIGIVGAVAFVVLVWAGIKRITSSGAIDQKSEAKEQIWAALMGLGLVLLSFLILNTINPTLVSTTLPPVGTPSTEVFGPPAPQPDFYYVCVDSVSNQVIGDVSYEPKSCTSTPPQILYPMVLVVNATGTCLVQQGGSPTQCIASL